MGGFRPTPEGFLWFFIDWYNGNVADHDVPTLVSGDAYVVWFCFTLGLNQGRKSDLGSTRCQLGKRA